MNYLRLLIFMYWIWEVVQEFFMVLLLLSDKIQNSNKLKKIILKSVVLLITQCLLSLGLSAQQMPYYSQFVNNYGMLNPAFTGVKGLFNAVVDYRTQWVGYDGAPQTSTINLNSRFLNGKMGAGLYMMQDVVGPSQQTNFGANYAYHIHFPDCELSTGLSGNYTKYTLNGNKITLHNTQDPSIDQTVSSTVGVPDANVGFYLYNDRFHIGFSALHLLQSKAKFYTGDTLKKSIIKYAPQMYGSLGYNYSQNSDYVWENTLLIDYVQGPPTIMLDYTLLVHYKRKIYAGASVRLNDAIALHLGVTILEGLQVSYSYDIIISKLQSYNSGSHEIMLIYNFDYTTNNRNSQRAKRFAHQRYSYML